MRAWKKDPSYLGNRGVLSIFLRSLMVGAGVGSEAVVGNGVFLGMNGVVNGGLSVGDFAFVGMSSNVVKSVEARQMVFGNPARPIPRP